MSKRETPMILTFWNSTGGTLITEYPAVQKSDSCGPRRLDAVIIPAGDHRRVSWKDVSLEGEDVIVVQAKAGRLGMYLMGQAVFSAELVKRYHPRSIRSVALCYDDDSELHPLLDRFPEVDVVVLGRDEVADLEVVT